MKDRETQFPFKNVEVAIAMQESVAMSQAECCNQAINGLSDR